MYIPAAFQRTDLTTLWDFIDQHSFATLVSQQQTKEGQSEPWASHLPLLLQRDSGPYGQLLGHFAKGNPQAAGVDGARVLVVYQGPHAYISPTWYETQNTVPTWNYVAVHAYGTLRVITERDRLLDLLRQTVSVYEAPLPQPWSMDVPTPEFIEQLAGGIVGFEVLIDRLEGKWKLNQNHPVERREKVIHKLRERGTSDCLAIADLMQATLPESA